MYTTGGQGTWKEFLTLPNILKVFNPKLIGYAYGDSQADESFSQFNVAEVGALSRDIPFMTRELVKRMKMDKRVNLTEDWKVKRKYVLPLWVVLFNLYFSTISVLLTVFLFLYTDDNDNDGLKYFLSRVVLRRLYQVP